jgi:hypothetical protein
VTLLDNAWIWFWEEPREAAAEAKVLMAACTATIADCAPATVSRLRADPPRSADDEVFTRLTFTVSAALVASGPTWKVSTLFAEVVFRRLTPA